MEQFWRTGVCSLSRLPPLASVVFLRLYLLAFNHFLINASIIFQLFEMYQNSYSSVFLCAAQLDLVSRGIGDEGAAKYAKWLTVDNTVKWVCRLVG